ncbi:MAG: class I SAM-dependent methyltransferase [Pseudomonadota bacterium]
MAGDVTHWAASASQWIDWVRAKDHDAFWAYRDAFETFVGRGPGDAIEIGCGEGRIARVLGSLGWTVTAVEPVPQLLQAARDADSAETYVEARAGAVPLPDAGFDLVVLYNVLMDVDDLEGSVAEAVRLLKPGGRLLVGLVHPIMDVLEAQKSGALEERPYFGSHPVDVEVETDGLSMRFHGWRRPLSAYVNVLAETGLRMARMEEPKADPSHPATERFSLRLQLPTFLWMDLRKD